MSLTWPDHLEPYFPPGQRETTNKFSSGWSKTRRELKREFERMDVDRWSMDHESGSHGDSAVVVTWKQGGIDRMVGCSRYTDKSDNLRSIYLWVKETRMSGDRPVATAQDAFAAAALPAGDEDDPIALGGKEDPHEILGVEPNATDQEVREAFQDIVKTYHGDSSVDGESDPRRLQKVREAKREMLQ